MPEPCGSLVTERALASSTAIALEQDGKHVSYSFGKFSMAECSCFGLSWFVWEPIKGKSIGWLRLKTTSKVLSVKPDGRTLCLKPKDSHVYSKNQLWSLYGNPGSTKIRSQQMENGQHLYLHVDNRGYVGLTTDQKNLQMKPMLQSWRIKQGTNK